MLSELFETDALQRLVDGALGPGFRIRGVTRLRGGTKKGVFRVSFDAGRSIILYVWGASENLWPAIEFPQLDPFSDTSGLDLFEAAHQILTASGVRTPGILYVDRSATDIPNDMALVEDIGDCSLADLLADDPVAAAHPMNELRSALDVMRSATGPRIGKVGVSDQPAGSALSLNRSCETIVLDRALEDLESAAHQLSTLADMRNTVANALSDAAAEVMARDDLSVVHGELGPDHVLVDGDGRSFIIDIEGLMYFDVEWEHVFLKIRFPDHYKQLRPDGLDEGRLALYQLAYHLALVAGPLRFLGTDLSDRARMERIIEWNLGQVLSLAG